ncbi:hypothetical protein THAOC_25883 [Thalassiosira oceanica]|uniref:Uncharacterized protein n=1 Tax=Thalassiosira oceanica TaxID=159749 RepID=K0RMW2_THAOC|nr:hypothetical protein THAOC_25883 [Thalassiosira oceanica]|eukprot:EJK54485.1 hypothetical protein THAOC_25883 [Thalassiosira oceanica]
MRLLLIGRWFVSALSAHITRRTWKYYDLICKVFCSSSLPLDCYFGEGAFIHALVSTLNRKKPLVSEFAAVAHAHRSCGWVVIARHARGLGTRPRPQSTISQLAKALDRGKGQNWQTLRFNFTMADRPREKRVEGREWSGSPYARPIATSPLGVDRSAHLQRDYSTLSSSVGSAGTTTIGRVELLHGLPWAIPMALRPPLSIKRAGATANLCIIARARPAEVPEPLITSLLWKPAATEVRCGIELSPCSAACPSGTIYTSFWPNICAGLHAGTSAAPLSVGLPFEFGFTAQTTPPPG